MNERYMDILHVIRRMMFHHADYDFKELGIIENTDNHEAVKKAAEHVIDIVDSWHLERWKSGFGYHYAIGNGHGIPDGWIWPGRTLKYCGAHTKCNNHDSIGIMLMGDLTKHAPTDKQVKACIRLATHLCSMYGLDPMGHYRRRRFLVMQEGPVISGHRDWKGHETNDCPGSLYMRLPEIREAVKEELNFAYQPPGVYFLLSGNSK